MKTSRILSVSLAAGLAGVAAFALANSAFVAALPGDAILGVGSALAMIGFAAADYARRYDPLPLPSNVLRPTLPRKVAGDELKIRAAA
jgi:hypothetical protein